MASSPTHWGLDGRERLVMWGDEGDNFKIFSHHTKLLHSECHHMTWNLNESYSSHHVTKNHSSLETKLSDTRWRRSLNARQISTHTYNLFWGKAIYSAACQTHACPTDKTRAVAPDRCFGNDVKRPLETICRLQPISECQPCKNNITPSQRIVINFLESLNLMTWNLFVDWGFRTRPLLRL